jgi:hypothetical protein
LTHADRPAQNRSAPLPRHRCGQYRKCASKTTKPCKVLCTQLYSISIPLDKCHDLSVSGRATQRRATRRRISSGGHNVWAGQTCLKGDLTCPTTCQSIPTIRLSKTNAYAASLRTTLTGGQSLWATRGIPNGVFQATPQRKTQYFAILTNSSRAALAPPGMSTSRYLLVPVIDKSLHLDI